MSFMHDNSTMEDEIFYAWFAGYYEGEGSIVLTRPKVHGGRYLRMSIGSTDEDVLMRIHKRLGGSLSGPRTTLTPRGAPGKPIYNWQLTRTNVVRMVAEGILPYLGDRRSADVQRCLRDQKFGPTPTRTFEERFWGLVDKSSSCWEWKGHKDRYGFGTWCPSGNDRRQAHRQAIEWIEGKVPPRVENLCGLKSCVRPEHWRSTKKVRS